MGIIEKITKNTFVKMFSALLFVCVLSAAGLVCVYNYAMPKITANVTSETGKAIRSIFAGAGKIEKTGEKDIYKVSDKDGNISGYAFLAEGNGYQGTIKLIVGVAPDIKTLKGIKVLESQETPGLGAEINSEKFQSQFENLSVTGNIEYVKNQKPQKDNQIEAITGATISSRSVVKILNDRISQVRKLINGK